MDDEERAPADGEHDDGGKDLRLSDDHLLVLSTRFGEREAAFFDGLPLDDRRQLATAAGVTQDPRFVRKGFGRLLIQRYRSLRNEGRLEAAAGLISVLLVMAPELIGVEQRADLAELGAAELIARVDRLSREVSLPLAGLLAVVLGQIVNDERLEHHGETMLAGSDPAPPGDGHTKDDDPDDVDGESALMFSSLDRLLIRAVIDTAAEAPGALDAPSIAAAVDEVIRLNSSRKESWFHAGFVEVLCNQDPDVPNLASNVERRSWYRFGRLSALLRLGDDAAVRAEVKENSSVLLELLQDPPRGRSIAAGVVAAELDGGNDRLLAQLLEVAPPDAHGIAPCFVRVYERARAQIEDEPTLASRLFRALERFAGSAVGLDTADGRYVTTDDVVADLRRRQSAAMRVSRRFMDARDKLDTSPEPDSAWIAGLLAAERGLIKAEVSHLTNLRWPESDEAVAEQAARLRLGEDEFLAAIAADPDQHRASLALGLIAMADRDFESAAEHLSLAERGFARDGAPVAGQLRHFAGALCGVAQMYSGTGVAGAAYKAVSSGLESGAQLPAQLLDGAAWELAFRAPDFAARLVHDAVGAGLPISAFQGAIEAVLEHGGTDPVTDLLVRTAVENPGIDPADRLELYLRAIRSALSRPGSDAEALFENAEDFVAQAGIGRLDETWSRALVDDELLCGFLGPDAHFKRLDVLKRTGRLEEAGAVAETLFHRAVNGDRPALADDLLELIEDLGADAGHVASLRRLIERVATEVDVAVDKPMRFSFVGGNETQARYQAELDRRIADWRDGNVSVDWTFSGWDANWKRFADRVEGSYRTSDAVILSYFVRTNLGRRLRRTAGEAGLPWIPCAGHGQDALFRAVVTAVEVVQRSRGQ